MITTEEARRLLRELGFTVGDDAESLSNMLRVFQRSFQLPQTGELDVATSAKIVEVHGIEVPPADV